MRSIRLHNMVKHTSVLGPGKRAAIWFQGCKRNCSGCMSPDTRPLNEGKEIAIDSILKEIYSIDDIEGITISGGEPFLQVEGLYYLLKELRKNTSLSVIIYTGFKLEELKKMKNEKINEIVSDLADIIIDGEYIEELNDGTSLKGSSNQQVYFVTDRYKCAEYLYSEKKRNVEILVSDREMFFIGVPDKQTFDKWLKISSDFSGK